jgi:hypothetical protein
MAFIIHGKVTGKSGLHHGQEALYRPSGRKNP